MTKYNLYWFSGTGNTKIIVDTFAETIREQGGEIDLHKIEKYKNEPIDTTSTIGVAFPVAAFTTYPFIWKFIESLPVVTEGRFFFFDTLGGFSGAIVGPLRREIEKKGYRAMGAVEIVMPSNYFVKKVDEAKNAKRIEAGKKKIEKFAIDLYKCQSKWAKPCFFSKYVAKIARSNFLWKNMIKSHTFVVDNALCNGCSLCVNLCPVGNITRDLHGKIVFGESCELCMRCTSFCPSGAIKVNKKKYVNYSSVKSGELLNNS